MDSSAALNENARLRRKMKLESYKQNPKTNQTTIRRQKLPIGQSPLRRTMKINNARVMSRSTEVNEDEETRKRREALEKSTIVTELDKFIEIHKKKGTLTILQITRIDNIVQALEESIQSGNLRISDIPERIRNSLEYFVRNKYITNEIHFGGSRRSRKELKQ
jgi:hypothetical protein